MEDIEEINRSERYFESELPKTVNKVFGSLEDFVYFFSKRGPEILVFTDQFQKLTNSNDLEELNNKILPRLVECLEKELLEPILEQLNDTSITKIKKNILLKTKERHEDLISLFKMPFVSLEEFYGSILKAYTMNTCLYGNLNRYLRNESWIEMDNLLPYVFCLCKAFFHLKLKQSFLEEEKDDEIKHIKNELKSMILYRGTALDKASLSCYSRIQSFSWNSVTSTTTSEQEAKRFMYISTDVENEKYPVMFIIEVPIANIINSEYLEWINVQQYSVMPKEDEIILAPGSVFELGDVLTDINQVTTIRIKLKNEIKSLAYKGFMMQGALQSKMMTERGIKIMCLEGDELHEALKCLSGNKLIEQIEFCLCKFNDLLLEEMTRILITMKSTQRLKFVSCFGLEKSKIFDLIIEKTQSWSILRIEILEQNYSSQIFSINHQECEWRMNFKRFDENSKGENKVLEEREENLWLQELRHLHRVTSLTLNFSEDLKRADEGINVSGFQCLENLSQINLNISIPHGRSLTDKGVRHLCSHGLKHMNQLTSLNLNFSKRPEKYDYTQDQEYQRQSVPVNLFFSTSNGITDEGVDFLSLQGLKHFKKLTSLRLDFSSCQKITDKGVETLCSKGLRHLDQLKDLNLSFSNYKDITDKGLKILSSQGLKNLSQLTSLNLSFSNCSDLSDEGLDNLCSQDLKYLRKLISLSLDFSQCQKITNEGLKKLCSEELKHLNQLISLSLNFSNCSGISDKGFDHLCSQDLKYLNKLTSLHLDFSKCRKITDEGLDKLCSNGFKHLNQLKSLSLNFANCGEITNAGVQNLNSQGLPLLSQLTSLKLDFTFCGIRVSERKKNRSSKVLKYLKCLNQLNLNFLRSSKLEIQKEVIFPLQKLENGCKLTSLHLNFSADESLCEVFDVFLLSSPKKSGAVNIFKSQFLSELGNIR